jgi:hypothetical protein
MSVGRNASALELVTLLMDSLWQDCVRHHSSEYVPQRALGGVADIARSPSW